jgi:hypothetical protein
MQRKSFLFMILVVLFAGCDEERSIVPNTHDFKVPEIIGLTYSIDTNAVGQKVIHLRWGYDSLRYGTDRLQANLRDWEIYRSSTDTSQFTSRGKTFFPVWDDASNEVQPAGRDSVVIYYRIFPNGYLVDNIQYIGKPTDVIEIVVRKK